MRPKTGFNEYKIWWGENITEIFLNISYEIIYNKEIFDPEEELMLRMKHPQTMQFIDMHDVNFCIEPFQSSLGHDVKRKDLALPKEFTPHKSWTNQKRDGEWILSPSFEFPKNFHNVKNKKHLLEFNEIWADVHKAVQRLDSTDSWGNLNLKPYFQFFQFNQSTGKCEDYDLEKISNIKILEITSDYEKNLKLRLEDLNTAKEHEKLLEFEEAAKIYKAYEMADDVIRVRKASRFNQTIIHGDYVDDRDTIVKDSVINRSNVGVGDDKFTKLEIFLKQDL